MADYNDTFTAGTGDDVTSTIFKTEYSAIETAIATKVDNNSGTATDLTLNTSVSGTAVLDEDDMATDSATQLATQQSIKAYVDSQHSNVYKMVYDGFNDSIIVNPSAWTVTRVSTGLYTVTHSLGGADTRKIHTHVDCIQNSSSLVATHHNLTGNAFSVSVKNQSTLAASNGVIAITVTDLN